MAAEQRMQPLSDLRSYYDSVSKKELLDNLSQLRASVYKQYPEKESFLQFISRNIKEKGTKLVSKFKGSHDEDKEFDVEKFTNANFPECCHDICKELRIINKKHGDGIFVVADLNETERLLSKKALSITFYGSYNAGKSTLLNAILQNKFLPMGEDPETGLKLIIQPTSESEEFMPEGMRLSAELEGETFPNDMKKNCLKEDGEIIAYGVTSVYDTLKELNWKLRNDKDIQDKKTDFLLKVEIPLKLPVHDDWMLSLIDTPGNNEYHEHITKAASAGFKISSACLFITTNDCYRAEETVKFLADKYQKNRGIFKEGRMIIVMNKLDQITSDQKCGINKEEYAEKVWKYIQSKLWHHEAENIPREAVIPVYGKWAFEARMLAREPSNVQRKETVVRILSQRSSQPFGQGENREKVLADKPSDVLAKELEQISNITVLERRLQDMANHRISLWIEKLKDDLSSYCETSKSKLLVKREESEESVKDLDSTISARLEAITEIYEHYKKIHESARYDRPTECKIWKTLKNDYDEDIEIGSPLSKVKKAIDTLIDEFKQESTIRKKAKDYEPQAFIEEDMAVFLKKVRDKIQEEIKRCFSQMFGTYNHNLKIVDCNIIKMGSLMRERLGPCTDRYKSLESEVEILKTKYPMIKVPDFSGVTATIETPPMYIDVFEKIKELYKDMIKTIKESFFLSEDDTESSSDFPDQGGTCDQSEDSLSSDVREIAEISSSSESSSKSSFMSKLSLPNNTEDSLVASLELPTSAITEDPSDVNITPRRTTPPKIVVLNKKKKRAQGMDSAVNTMGDKIDEEIGLYLQKIEEYALDAYWSSYCKSAITRLKLFDELFKDVLDKQMKDLKMGVEELQQKIAEHKFLSYRCVLLSFLSAQLKTVADNYKQNF